MKFLGVIPSRYQSTRFPGKPLVDIKGKSMVQRVYEQCLLCTDLDEVIVATDDQRIFDHVLSFGGKVMMTSADHINGTSRCAEVAQAQPGFEGIINIQGDEPFISPEQISDLIHCFDEPNTQIASMFKKIKKEEELFSPNVVKVVLNQQFEAMYFSRSPIPFIRNEQKENWLNAYNFYHHVGIYGFRNDFLMQLNQLTASSLELAESLEQLRWLENGFKIKMAETSFETIAIDTPEDLAKIL
ncbi:3-deoxy-manno-octulosonate cytidylyltransferase [Solitalea lacus]|uniref:3-deoxy-manno-octulosonate cytidylyltransferase n=1 Tax=Solitalea lacus TaxID=2911172 RepID=UPI001EDC14EC|nr:3-deoxy-manno-octulosonate cytidylyltransferase [Solitalea lacus]UKJ05797.1 3-deoxy-manno-octulosonate cytidylyltransferase [Solitalea lacus]